CHLTYGTPYSF
nr:immunoglobulin light chain junction region [Macaca mulatta]